MLSRTAHKSCQIFPDTRVRLFEGSNACWIANLTRLARSECGVRHQSRAVGSTDFGERDSAFAIWAMEFPSASN